ncbi:nuclear transport factor 2 family protein [Cytophagaceae bacterium YF14B1]|uniref:Nuclear transport factor 2 family protein n=1 Tax=Xanthocytophaga flava TaxID=3048013 RepID=A0AAE3QPN1_9BACT|nr:nuclear transport factor 2 family protein [Xanthocytophaga flavus]MDJ1480925.1 nuclear transport factor 2 family protein [Xanthocytophaga flavus]
MNSQEIEDRVFLRELVDSISILADKKDVHAQVQLFSENAISETYINSKPFLKLKGRIEMEKAFTEFLKNVEIVYHFNGQQQVAIQGNNATGTCYCLITMIGTEDGKKIKTSIGAIYQDTYIRQNNRWLITERIGNFEWQEKHEVNS